MLSRVKKSTYLTIQAVKRSCLSRFSLFNVLIILITVAAGSAACTDQKKLQSIPFGTPKSPMSLLVWLTEELGYFKQQGIKLEIQEYPSGKRALAALLRGEQALAVSAETPFVIASFTQPDLRLYATLGQSDNDIRVLARTDHGIQHPADLRGKTIATQRGSAVHFFLSSFLLKHHINSGDIKIQFMKAEELPAALASGDIDAISMRDPILSQTRKLTGENKVVEFSEPGLYTKTYNLVGSKNFTEKYPGVMQKILSALNEAAVYVDAHPQQAIDLATTRLLLSRKRIMALWPGIRLSVTLDQGLLTALQEEAQWAVSSGLIKENEFVNGKMPDLLKRLNPLPLSKAVPHAVGLIGIIQR